MSESLDIHRPGKCYFCQEKLGLRVAFSNGDYLSWDYMPIKESAHPECYIEYCVKIAYQKCQEQERK